MSDVALSVVIPAHNEVSLLGSTITNLAAGLSERQLSYELVVVENGSSDETLDLAHVLAQRFPQLRVIHLAKGNYGEALAAGFHAARGTLVANVDVDYYSLSFLDDALALMTDDDVALVVASKRMAGSKDTRPIVRRVLTFGFALALHALVHIEVSDAHGMKVMRKDILSPVVDRCVLRGSLFDVEMVLRATRSGIHAAELPATVAERRPPRTPVLARSLESFVGLLRLRRLIVREERLSSAAQTSSRRAPNSRESERWR